MDAEFQNFENSLWDAFRALISNESMAGYIDTRDEKDVTMLQRAVTFFDLDIIRLLLEEEIVRSSEGMEKRRNLVIERCL